MASHGNEIMNMSMQEMKLDAFDAILRGDCDDAVGIYTRMISIAGNVENDELSSLFSDRAACRLLAKQFQLGLEDCDRAISINERNIDGYVQKW
ncbi:unnamed protein product [Rotaria sp. Silwood2]|nr:unnamed protein product [Rotaria sp. Silwood2]CAF2663100.1 unnamed protein product [Rotaria sp. Silwood2]CAF3009165.1 unnamed protein product [Rotaria sp. Silwood2]CAF3911626.1 unnamed protein product [Rotaria sp. Silwood2]CAF4027070.1 unnamed protein product [Rotaria sp. Silwood2]